jgi:hypothetical protein
MAATCRAIFIMLKPSIHMTLMSTMRAPLTPEIERLDWKLTNRAPCHNFTTFCFFTHMILAIFFFRFAKLALNSNRKWLSFLQLKCDKLLTIIDFLGYLPYKISWCYLVRAHTSSANWQVNIVKIFSRSQYKRLLSFLYNVCTSQNKVDRKTLYK